MDQEYGQLEIKFLSVWEYMTLSPIFPRMPYLKDCKTVRLEVRIEMDFIPSTQTGNKVQFSLQGIKKKKKKTMPAAGNWTQ